MLFEYLAYFIFHASLCVSPGNVGLAAIHSLSFGTPVCTHSNLLNQMPEIEAVEEGVTGCYFDENNLDNLIEVINNWLNKKIKRERRRSFIHHFFIIKLQIVLKKNKIESEEIRIDAQTGKNFTFFKDPDNLPIELYEK